jgi:signal peptidase II
MVRKPFFFSVSLAAIVFIVSLYSRITPRQRALRWGLPLVLGGALGNLADRIVRGSVVDFIDYRADWVASMNKLVAMIADGWHVTDHWPTFNVADICICVGVGLMAVDMMSSKQGPEQVASQGEAPEPNSEQPALASETEAKDGPSPMGADPVDTASVSTNAVS